MLNPFDQTTLIVAAVCLACGFGSGYTVQGWHLNGKHAAERLDDSDAATKALADMTADRDALAGELSDANDQHAAELRTAQNETTRLRDRMSAGSGGLRIAAVCPEHRLGPQAPSAPRVDTGTRAELDQAARQSYFALRDGIDRAGAQLAACQSELRLRTD